MKSQVSTCDRTPKYGSNKSHHQREDPTSTVTNTNTTNILPHLDKPILEINQNLLNDSHSLLQDDTICLNNNDDKYLH